MKNLPEKLKYARKKMGLKCLEVSRMTGIRYSDYLRFERGTQEPKFSQLSKIANLFKREIDFFLNEEEPNDPIFFVHK